MTTKPEATASTPSHNFVVIDGLRLHYLDFGGDGEPVVLLHGVTSHAWVWRDLPPLMGRGRWIALDARGHGDSQWSPDDQYTTDTLASDVVTFIDAMDLGPVVLIGASWGGLVGLDAAIQRPELVNGLVMVDIPPSFPGPPSEVETEPSSFASHSESVQHMRTADEYLDEDIAEVIAAHGHRPGRGGRLYTKHDDYFHKHRPHRADDYWDALGHLETPLLIVRAEGSAHLSEPVAARMTSVARDAQLVTISQTGHRIPADNPLALATALRTFLGKEISSW